MLLKEDGTFQLIRRAETPEDYFATFDFTGIFDRYFGKAKSFTMEASELEADSVQKA